ncbi:MAG: hypothetical protein IPP72_07040 [Chitinophagaceae bacterium]|nr:hypothetical protein [Chitinophagaceae bacterium]
MQMTQSVKKYFPLLFLMLFVSCKAQDIKMSIANDICNCIEQKRNDTSFLNNYKACADAVLKNKESAIKQAIQPEEKDNNQNRINFVLEVGMLLGDKCAVVKQHKNEINAEEKSAGSNTDTSFNNKQVIEAGRTYCEGKFIRIEKINDRLYNLYLEVGRDSIVLFKTIMRLTMMKSGFLRKIPTISNSALRNMIIL